MAKESVNHQIKQIISAVDKFLITDYGSYNREQLGAEGAGLEEPPNQRRASRTSREELEEDLPPASFLQLCCLSLAASPRLNHMRRGLYWAVVRCWVLYGSPALSRSVSW